VRQYMCLVTNVSNENQALGKAFEIESHPFKVKSTPVTKKVVLEINSHPVKVTKNVIGKEVTCRLDLGGALGGQLPKGCRERKCARSFVSFASRSPEVGIMCQLLVILISGSIVMSPGIVCERGVEGSGFGRGGVRVRSRLSSRGWGRGKVSCMRAGLSRLSV